jgi:glycosyltransferase involved in cell wall biosynthesis
MGLQINKVEFTEPAGQGNATTNQQRVCIVGPSTRFLRGISDYTIRQINEFVKEYSVSAILMRQLLPARFYPGRERVGSNVTEQKTSPRAKVLDGVDWYWFPSLFRAMGFLLRERPTVIIFHWWTGTVLHSYLFLAILARMLHAKVVIEFHEVLDPGEWLIPIAKRYVKLFAHWLMRIAQGFVIHSEFDRSNLDEVYGLHNRPVAVIPLAPFDQYQLKADKAILRDAPPDCLNILYFGLICSYKGVEHLWPCLT